jgi:hypothetical protein
LLDDSCCDTGNHNGKGFGCLFFLTMGSASAGSLPAFRAGFYDRLTARSDALFELTDAILCQSGPVASLPVLSLAGMFGRGHGGL